MHWQFYVRTDYGLIYVLYTRPLVSETLVILNGAPYYIPGNKILELSWPFCWYWKEITKRLLRLKPRLKHNIYSERREACTGDNRQ